MNNKPLFKKLYYSPVLVVFLIGVFILTNSVNVLAAGSQTYPLPYVISDHGYNSIFNSQSLALCVDELNSYTTSYTDYLIYSVDYSYHDSDYQQYECLVVSDPHTKSNWSYDQTFDYSQTAVYLEGSDYIEVRMQYRNGSFTSSSSRLNYNDVTVLGSQTTRVNKLWGTTEGTWTPHYPCYYSGSGIYDYNNHLVIAQDVIINQPSPGSPTGPNTGHHITNPNGGNPSNPPSYTINNYSWTTYTPPVVDLTSIEGLLKGIIDSVQSIGSWLGSNLSGMLANLISNIKGLFDFVGDLLRYIGREIQDSIHDFASFIYDNLVSFFKPYFDTFNNALFGLQELFSLGYDENGSFSVSSFFTKLLIPSASDVVDLMEDHDHFGVISFWSSLNTKYVTIWTSIFNTSSVKRIYVPSTTWHGQTIGGFYIDFSWYDDYKVYGDTVISAFLIIGYFYWLYLNINYFLRGTTPSHIPNMTDEKGVHL